MPRHHAALRCVAIASVLCSLAGSCARSQATGDEGPLALRLLADSVSHWRMLAVPGAHVYLARGGTGDSSAAAVAESVTVIRRDLRALLEMSEASDSARPASLFFLSSRDEMRRLAGRPLAGFVQQGEPTGVFVVSPGYRYGSLLRHELSHLYTFEAWGPPSAGRWLVEGIAAWTAGACQGHSPDELAAGARARQALVSLTDLARDFDRIPEDVAVPQAASVVGFLIRRDGLESLRQRWREAPGTGHPLGPNGPALEAAWLAAVRDARPATLDVPRLMVEGC